MSFKFSDTASLKDDSYVLDLNWTKQESFLN